MSKELSAIVLIVALGFTNLAMANQATLDALVASGLSFESVTEEMFLEAEDDELVELITALIVAADGDNELVSTIISASVAANPSIADTIVSQAVAAAPNSAEVIKEAASDVN